MSEGVPCAVRPRRGFENSAQGFATSGAGRAKLRLSRGFPRRTRLRRHPPENWPTATRPTKGLSLPIKDRAPARIISGGGVTAQRHAGSPVSGGALPYLRRGFPRSPVNLTYKFLALWPGELPEADHSSMWILNDRKTTHLQSGNILADFATKFAGFGDGILKIFDGDVVCPALGCPI
jgi:hypothetical protein